MKIVITGGAGFLGSMLTRELLTRMDAGGAPLEADGITSLDLAPSPVDDPRVHSVVGNLADQTLLEQAIDHDTVGVYHLAAVLSGGSEQDFDLAMAVNVDATRALLERMRAVGQETGRPPHLVFTSSLAVFGGTMPEAVPEHWAEQPDSTYGAFKAIGELLVNEYSRKGFLDGRICRLPTISVRPGKPNSAASSFASGILREPLNGIASQCPVPHGTRMWLSSPRTAVANLVHAMGIPAADLPGWRGMNIPGICVTVQEMLESLERVGGQDARALVTDVPDRRVMDIVCSWPGDFDVERMLGLGFVRDEDFDDVVRQYVDDHLS
ncbi:D-erythronate dehydrogenase [Luteococcus japonicus]|uniref:Nucleoside-diphosphate-sugar epimerases n=2 Tax=Luteococcus TaxID=33983 RepID=A0A1R4KD66_9ACTN|nr:D-erythronate dehydrogenase [Luteococcus japonicus]SJN42104.1 Nucleoside-diphosphate-sugar epimerases [Luteococcus japonicus LSP_Lj1]